MIDFPQIILEVVVPRFLKHLKEGTTQKESLSAAQAEIQAITNIAVSIRALINSCEIFTRYNNHSFQLNIMFILFYSFHY